MDTERLLNSVGKEIFINYFYDFKNCSDKNSLAQILLNENPKATKLGGQITRISCATRIINDKNALEQALEMIINSKRLSVLVITKARDIRLKEIGR
ncbi:MAG: hypothetical protein FWD90_03630 [Defluviitaleaceae bacterium]|nr:hypothetical protein [Defluviitaleaceae bacterium]